MGEFWPRSDRRGFTHLLSSAVDDGQICVLLQAEVSAEAPRVLLRGEVIQAGLKEDPPILEIRICYEEHHKYTCVNLKTF